MRGGRGADGRAERPGKLAAIMARVGSRRADGCTGAHSIHVAAQDGDGEELVRCLGNGVPIDVRNKRQQTALMLAAEHGHVGMVQLLLDKGANACLTNTKRLTAHDIASRRLQQNGRARRDSARSEIETLLREAETRQSLVSSCTNKNGIAQQPRCPICGEKIRQRQRVDFLRDDGQSLYVSNFLRSDGLQKMRSHPNNHYHSFLETRQLRKEVSESWGLLAQVHDLIDELQLDPIEMVLFDLCSGKGLTAVSLALEFPHTRVVAVDIISEKCLPHTVDLTNLRYVEADLFSCAPMLMAEMQTAEGCKPLTGVLLGSHLCGRLSVQAVQLFQSLSHVAALVLSPCCWPRRRDYNSTDEELAELAGLMWLKATNSDTYTTWAEQLWWLLAAPSVSSLNGGCASDSGKTVAECNGMQTIGRAALSNRYVQQAIGFDGYMAPSGACESEPKADTEPLKCDPRTPMIAIGLKRDAEILSEKNVLITAIKKSHVYDTVAWQNHAKGAHRRHLFLELLRNFSAKSNILCHATG